MIIPANRVPMVSFLAGLLTPDNPEFDTVLVQDVRGHFLAQSMVKVLSRQKLANRLFERELLHDTVTWHKVVHEPKGLD